MGFNLADRQLSCHMKGIRTGSVYDVTPSEITF